jgi:hypothetical protein
MRIFGASFIIGSFYLTLQISSGSGKSFLKKGTGKGIDPYLFSPPGGMDEFPFPYIDADMRDLVRVFGAEKNQVPFVQVFPFHRQTCFILGL